MPIDPRIPMLGQAPAAPETSLAQLMTMMGQVRTIQQDREARRGEQLLDHVAQQLGSGEDFDTKAEQALADAGLYHFWPGVQEALTKARKSAADLHQVEALTGKTKAEADKIQQEAGALRITGLADLAAGLKPLKKPDGTYPPEFLIGTVKEAVDLNLLSKAEGGRFLESANVDPSMVDPWLTMILSRSQEREKLRQSAQTADTGTQNAATTARLADANIPILNTKAAQDALTLAGTGPTGLTADQRADNAIQAMNAATSRGQLGVAQAAERRQGQADQLAGANLPLGITGDAALADLPPDEQRIIKLLAEYKFTPPSGYALSRSPIWAARLARAAAYDPAFDATQYQARQQLRKDFTSGKGASTIRSLNTLIGHLDSLDTKAKALSNSSLPVWNAIANYGITQVGDSRVKEFEAAANAVQNELATVFKNTGATDQEIKAWRATFDAAQSPEQLKGVVATAIDLMESRMAALESQWTTGMGKPIDFRFLTPKAEQTLKKLGGSVEGSMSTPSDPFSYEAYQAGRK